jgi:hypothetical protein
MHTGDLQEAGMKEIGIATGNNVIPRQQDEYFGRMNNPTSASVLNGLCGDEMEFHLYIRNDIIEDINYYANGCQNIRNCGYATAKRAKG